jgi:hypothetical protein
LNLFTLTFRALGRNHIASTPVRAVAMLCFLEGTGPVSALLRTVRWSSVVLVPGRGAFNSQLDSQSLLVRTSSESVIDRAPDGRGLPGASSAGAGCRPPVARPVAPCPRGARPRPDAPNPQSQSLSRSYGSGLPTSLIHIVLSTRGCSPWGPAAVMGTTRREDYSLARIFKGRRGRAGPGRSAGLFQPPDPISGRTVSRVLSC